MIKSDELENIFHITNSESKIQKTGSLLGFLFFLKDLTAKYARQDKPSKSELCEFG